MSAPAVERLIVHPRCLCRLFRSQLPRDLLNPLVSNVSGCIRRERDDKLHSRERPRQAGRGPARREAA